MNCLPTLKEADALPDLIFVQEQTSTLLNKNNHFDINLESDSASWNFIIEQLFVYVSYSVIKTKIYNEKKIIMTADSIFLNLVEWGTKHLKEHNLFIFKMLNVIMNCTSEYYKTNGKDSINSAPFGEHYLYFDQQQEWAKNLKKHDKVDYVKKTPDGRNIWVPAEVVGTFSQSGKLEVKYLNDTQVYLVYNLIVVRKFGEMKESYQWRENLQSGQRIMYFFDNKWSEFEIFSVDKNGTIEISEVIDG